MGRYTCSDVLVTHLSSPKAAPRLVACEYCASAVSCPGRCESCGAPARLVRLTEPVEIQHRNRIEITHFGDTKRRYVEGLP
jgi:hypothetical protein